MKKLMDSSCWVTFLMDSELLLICALCGLLETFFAFCLKGVGLDNTQKAFFFLNTSFLNSVKLRKTHHYKKVRILKI